MMLLNLGLVIPRVIIGLLFIGHGSQKLFGWFGGGGIKGTASFFQQLGLRPATFFAVIAGLFEFLGGIGLTLGLVTPVAALAITAVMLTAGIFVHVPKGLWVAQGGSEYPLVLIAAMALFGLGGPGSYALDSIWNLSYPWSANTPLYYAIGFVVVLVLAVLLRLIEHAPSASSQHAPPRAA